MELKWIQCQGDVWCKLNAVNLDHEHFNNLHGVYIIWHGGPNPKVVYVGQGNIKERIKKHRSDPRIQQYVNLDLYVTWGKVDEKRDRDGVELYLAKTWNLEDSGRHPQTSPPMKVNSPW